MTEPRSSNLNVPNVLTVLRIIMVPLFVAVLFWQPANQGWRFTASGIFVAAMLTDLADRPSGWQDCAQVQPDHGFRKALGPDSRQGPDGRGFHLPEPAGRASLVFHGADPAP